MTCNSIFFLKKSFIENAVFELEGCGMDKNDISLFSKIGRIIKIKKNKKEPVGKWKNRSVTQARNNEKDLGEWEGNFGLVLVKHKNVVVIDIDADHLIPLFDDLAKKTLTIKTIKGIHIYINSKRKLLGRKVRFCDFPVDLITDGYVLIPPSEIDGVKYEILYNNDILELDDVQEYVKNCFFGETDYTKNHEENKLDMLSFAKKHLGEPVLNGGHYLLYHCPLKDHNDKNPSFAVYKNNAICFSEGKYFTPMNFMSEVLGWDENKISVFHKDENFDLPGLLNPITDSNIKSQYRDYARAIAKKYITKKVPNGIIYVYDPNTMLYKSIEKKNVFLRMVQSVCKMNADGKSEMFDLGQLKGILSFFNKVVEDDDSCIVSFNNCVINTNMIGKGDIIKKLGPDVFTTIHIPHKYNTNALNNIETLIERTLRSILIDKGGDDKYITFLQFLGYVLIGSDNLQKMLLVTGVGANGKSVLAHILKVLLGENNIIHRSLQQMSSQFGLSGMVGKMLNIIGEIDSEGYVNTAVLKSIISNDIISIEEKGKEHYDARIRTKIIAFGNFVPRVTTGGEAYFRRFIHLELENQFYGEDADLDLNMKIDDDKDGIEWLIASAINEFVKMIIGGRWRYDKAPKEVQIGYEWGSDPLSAAMGSLIEYQANGRIKRSELLTKIRVMVNAYRPGYIEINRDWINKCNRLLMAWSGLSKRDVIKRENGEEFVKGFAYKSDIEGEKRIIEEKFGLVLDDF